MNEEKPNWWDKFWAITIYKGEKFEIKLAPLVLLPLVWFVFVYMNQ